MLLIILINIMFLIALGGYKFQFEYSLETGDWSLLQKSTGNKSGGHHRCVLCGLNFSDSNAAQFLCYSHIIAQIPKSIELSVNLFTQPNDESNEQMKENLGLKNMSGLFANLAPEERALLLSKMKHLKPGIDNLHNLKGHLSTLVDLERKHPQFDDPLFLTNLNKYLSRLSTAGTDMNGQSFRKLAILFNNVLLPSVADDRKNAFAALFRNWNEIQYLMYDFGQLATSDKSILDGMKTRMHLLTFLHLQQVI
jgi:hypothetical protein